jgi:hypothetical protein
MSNVKVYLRIKPHLSDREQVSLPMEVRNQSGRRRLYFQYRLQQNDTKIFSFDDIFEENSSQEEVYSEFSNDLMNSIQNGVRYYDLVQLLLDGIRPNEFWKVIYTTGR